MTNVFQMIFRKIVRDRNGSNIFSWQLLKLLMACWRRLHLQFRHRWMSGRTSKSSNGRKIARMARNSTIFGPNESSRRDLFLEKFSKSRNNRKVFGKLRKIFEKIFEFFFERCNLMGDVILSNTSLRETMLLSLWFRGDDNESGSHLNPGQKVWNTESVSSVE